MNTHIEFLAVEKEELPFLKDEETYKLTFQYTLTYDNEKDKKKSPSLGEISFQGTIVVKLDKEESKDLTKMWKKKQIPEKMVLPLYNFILKRCTIKSLSLEEDINLPFHLQLPQLKREQKQE